MKEFIAHKFALLLNDIVSLPNTLILFSVLVVITLIVVESIANHTKKEHQATGLDQKSKIISLDGAKALSKKVYISNIQGLSGQPDAVIIEHGYFIPVECKPLAKKMRDRYVAQLLVYMRLIEEFEGKKPPYGYLILGANRKRIKIQNTAEKQQWLQNIINQMQASLAGTTIAATPQFNKCKKCDVNKHCDFKLVNIGQSKKLAGGIKLDPKAA